MDKFSTTLAYEIENRWRVGIESSWNGSQYQYNNIRVNNYWFFAAMVQRKVNHFTVVLNVENLLNVRQFQFSPTVTGTAQAPEFAPVWAPLEGRVFNLSVKYDFK
jgi:iron complex outermembrane receptor protein/outer membrane receptor for ferrienterochelin and colicins